MPVSQFLNKWSLLLNAKSLAFKSIVKGANFTHSLGNFLLTLQQIR